MSQKAGTAARLLSDGRWLRGRNPMGTTQDQTADASGTPDVSPPAQAAPIYLGTILKSPEGRDLFEVNGD
eukprot:15160271-Heterocapsa_arctica.AAC.1